MLEPGLLAVSAISANGPRGRIARAPTKEELAQDHPGSDLAETAETAKRRRRVAGARIRVRPARPASPASKPRSGSDRNTSAWSSAGPSAFIRPSSAFAVPNASLSTNRIPESALHRAAPASSRRVSTCIIHPKERHPSCSSQSHGICSGSTPDCPKPFPHVGLSTR
jgi:hypothetical protein